MIRTMCRVGRYVNQSELSDAWQERIRERPRPGRSFDVADGSTLFLDEVGDSLSSSGEIVRVRERPF